MEKLTFFLQSQTVDRKNNAPEPLSNFTFSCAQPQKKGAPGLPEAPQIQTA